MGAPAPIVYILHGEDEFGMAKFVDDMQGKLGDPTTAEMNITRLDGKKYNFDELKNQPIYSNQIKRVMTRYFEKHKERYLETYLYLEDKGIFDWSEIVPLSYLPDGTKAFSDNVFKIEGLLGKK